MRKYNVLPTPKCFDIKNDVTEFKKLIKDVYLFVCALEINDKIMGVQLNLCFTRSNLKQEANII